MNPCENNSAQKNRDRLKAILVERSTDQAPPTVSKKMVICETGKGTPLYCIHGGAAGLASYRRIAVCHGLSRPVFGLQSFTKSVDDPIISSIDQLAQVHLNAINEHDPHGPLMLAGHSMAAVIALEVGQRLLAQGRDVRLLAVIDHPGPDIHLTTRDWLYWQWIAMSALPMGQRGRFVLDGIRYRIKSNHRIPNWIRRRFISNKTNASQKQHNKPQSAAEYRRRVSDASLQALRNYEPQPFSRPMVLFRARSGAPRLHVDSHGGWARISDGKIQVIDIPGHHMNIFQPPYVEVFSERLAECLKQYDHPAEHS